MEEVSRLFPTYSIHTLIACGGMGAVYQATQRSLDRTVAIKILPREFSTDAAFREGFESEAKAMAKLNHPNLISVYDFGEADGMLFIIMEYVSGKSLFHSAHGLAVDQAEAVSIVIGVCHGLAHAHENGILHRDIKPSNILLDASASPKIGDFGLARALEREIKEGEQIFGTPGYTAPEVLTPPFTFDHRADIFSVGVMLHELLTGQLPGEGSASASQTSGCTRLLDAVIFRATHPDPNYRFRSAEEMATELTKISGTPSRTLLTNTKTRSAPSLTSRALGAPGRPSALRPTASTAPRPTSTPATKPQLFTAKPAKRVESKDGNYTPLILVVLLVATVVVTVVILKGKKAAPPAHHTPPPSHTVAPAKIPIPPEEPPTTPTADPQEALRAARTAARHRVEPFFESYDRDLKASEAAGETGKRKALDETLAAALKSQSGLYVLELQNHIERLTRTGDQAAISPLEEEIRRLSEDSGYFLSIMRR